MDRSAIAIAISNHYQRDAFDRWVSHVNARLALRRAFDGLWSNQ